MTEDDIGRLVDTFKQSTIISMKLIHHDEINIKIINKIMNLFLIYLFSNSCFSLKHFLQVTNQNTHILGQMNE